MAPPSSCRCWRCRADARGGRRGDSRAGRPAHRGAAALAAEGGAPQPDPDGGNRRRVSGGLARRERRRRAFAGVAQGTPRHCRGAAALRYGCAACAFDAAPAHRPRGQRNRAWHGSRAAAARCAAPARDELERHARSAYAIFGAWRRFETDELPERVPLTLEQGGDRGVSHARAAPLGIQVQFQWSAAEAQHLWREGSVRLARAMLERQSRDLAKVARRSRPLLLRASPYLESAALTDALLQLTFRARALRRLTRPAPGWRSKPPSTKAGSVSIRHSSRSAPWSKIGSAQAGEVRQALDDSRVSPLADAVAESRRHLGRLLDSATIGSAPLNWLRQLPRYLKAEQRRWQRNSLPRRRTHAHRAELEQWSDRYRDLEMQPRCRVALASAAR